MVWICIFQVYRLGEQPKDYLIFSNKIMFLFGTGFKSINLKNISSKKRMISEYIIDETLIKVGSQYIWLWVAIEPKNKQILALTISIERNMLIAEKFISGLVKIQDTWKTFGFNKWWNILPSSLHVLKPRSPHSFQLREKYIERTMQYIKDRIEGFR